MTSKKCVCGKDVVLWYGPKDTQFALIGDEPEDADYQVDMPWTGKNGKLLRSEMMSKSLDISRFRRGNLFVHAKPSDDCKNKHVAKTVTELTGKRAVLLIGSEVTKFFTGMSITDISGLNVAELVTLFQADVVIPVPKPTVLFTEGFGEVRFALHNFSKELERLGIE